MSWSGGVIGKVTRAASMGEFNSWWNSPGRAAEEGATKPLPLELAGGPQDAASLQVDEALPVAERMVAREGRGVHGGEGPARALAAPRMGEVPLHREGDRFTSP